ncbi:MAG TPA: hypothetical protein VFR09_08445 [Alphaproteobacteria bacterium]|nr:hypothetical protein [Alphaproteobacteria bacterium]
MIKSVVLLSRLFMIGGVMFAMSGCMTDNVRTYQDTTNAGPVNNSNIQQARPSYSNNGVFDDNGVAPVPNNGSQNFGRRW